MNIASEHIMINLSKAQVLEVTNVDHLDKYIQSRTFKRHRVHIFHGQPV